MCESGTRLLARVEQEDIPSGKQAPSGCHHTSQAAASSMHTQINQLRTPLRLPPLCVELADVLPQVGAQPRRRHHLVHVLLLLRSRGQPNEVWIETERHSRYGSKQSGTACQPATRAALPPTQHLQFAPDGIPAPRAGARGSHDGGCRGWVEQQPTHSVGFGGARPG